MTRTADPAAVVDDAVRELLDTLADLVRDRPVSFDPAAAQDLLDQVSVALRRARGRIRRARPAPSTVDRRENMPAGIPRVDHGVVRLDVIRAPRATVALPEPPRLLRRPGPPIPRPPADTTRTGARPSLRVVLLVVAVVLGVRSVEAEEGSAR